MMRFMGDLVFRSMSGTRSAEGLTQRRGFSPARLGRAANIGRIECSASKELLGTRRCSSDLIASMKSQQALDSQGRSEARAVGALLIAGAGLVVLSLVLPHPSGGNSQAQVAIASVMCLAGLLCVGFASQISLTTTRLILGSTTVLTGMLIYESGVAAGQYGAIFVWVVLIGAYYLPRKIAFANLLWLLGVYAVTLSAVNSTGGFSPLTRWLFSAVSLSVVTVLTSTIVASRARADLRARRFFDLSHDMLCTVNKDGYLVEMNSAWNECLGYTAQDLRSSLLVSHVHPDDHERLQAEVAKLFAGRGTVESENRFIAKDESWHWLRWSATLASDESMIYARATDVTELKQVEFEREDLLIEVEMLARSDPLTGLPNRRVLDEQLPREMARARRGGTPLCVAIIDMDRFKDYNDSKGHLAGDAVLRECAITWDSKLRGEDTVVRYGGEEFLVVLPDCTIEHAAEIVERLRAATPANQTCSAGVACLDAAETMDEFLERADAALYRAKREGRDRLVC
jgi:diguanylate cyclase (GGDEF)-like protein/PAS domain S-box-containing protein